jgi:hypothetical protein
MLNRVATDFVLNLAAYTRYGMLHRSDWRKSATWLRLPPVPAAVDGYRLLTHPTPTQAAPDTEAASRCAKAG